MPAAASVSTLAAVLSSDSPVSARLDKWLWWVRLFKTRALAVAAIQHGSVRVNDHPVKPAREVRPGETVTLRQGVVTRTLRVLAVPGSRLGAKQVAAHCEDLTPPAEFEKARAQREQQSLARDKGSGRPTKRDRRRLDQLWE